MAKIPELTAKHLARAIPARLRKRLMLGQFDSGDDISALRRFVGLTQTQFAQAMGISIHTLRSWEQGRRHPDGPAIVLLRIAARHPLVIRENVESDVLKQARMDELDRRFADYEATPDEGVPWEEVRDRVRDRRSES
jgi:DNA-binding transcriptional regulator YiaG